MGIIAYSSNNSGGGWWLDDDAWQRLEDAGWVVHWVHDKDDPSHVHAPEEDSRWASFGGHSHAYDDEHQLTKVTPSGERWLGALAKSAAKQTDDPQAAVDEWENATGCTASDEGCNCCGPPHSFDFTDDEGKSHYFEVSYGAISSGWS